MSLGKLTAIAVAAMLLPACASVTRGTKEVLIVKSTPPGAAVALSNGTTCVTPCSLKMKRKHGVHLSITKDGYQTAESVVNTQVSSGGGFGMAGNVLVGGLIGAGVDASNGSMNEFVPNPLEISLTPLAETASVADPVVKPGESFAFDEYMKTGNKVPYDSKEREKLEKEQKLAKANAAKEARRAERKAVKEARASKKAAQQAAKAE